MSGLHHLSSPRSNKYLRPFCSMIQTISGASETLENASNNEVMYSCSASSAMWNSARGSSINTVVAIFSVDNGVVASSRSIFSCIRSRLSMVSFFLVTRLLEFLFLSTSEKTSVYLVKGGITMWWPFKSVS